MIIIIIIKGWIKHEKVHKRQKKKFKTLSVLITFDSSELVKFLLIAVTFNILLVFFFCLISINILLVKTNK